MTPTRRNPDDRHRQLAATVFDRNVVVEAGAGTGKTSLLVERLLVALGSGRMSLHQVAAITFTEKAAGEIRERLGDGLETLRAIAGGYDTRADAARGKEADRAYSFLRESCGLDDERVRGHAVDGLRALDRATVTTVHGFCAEILRAHPFEAGVSPEFEIDRGERVAAAFAEAWEEFLARELGAAATRTKLWARVLDKFDLPLVESVARALSRSEIPARVLAEDAPWPDARLLLGAEAGALAERIEAMLRAVPTLAFNARALLDAAQPALRALAEHGLNDELRQRLSAAPFSGDSPKPPKSVPGEHKQELSDLISEIRALVRRLACVDDAGLRDLVAATAPFARELRESLAMKGFIDFDGLLARARDVLCRSLAVREAVKARYAMLLVDEFQDTDPLQYDIVLFLAERSNGGATDPFRAELAPGRLFIVGDPKQSIYRFRGADYAAYRRAVAKVVEQGGLELTLTANFRALPEVLEPVNALFSAPGHGWEVSAFQSEYRPIDPVRAAGSTANGIELWSVLPAARAAAAERRHAEGCLIADRIREMHDQQQRPWKDFTILLRAFSEVSRYVRPLRDAGIPFVVTGGRTFHERTEVVRLLAHLRLLASPDDPVALLAWLRSPAGAVPDTELAAWAAQGGRWGRTVQPDPAQWPNLARALDDWRALEESVRDLPLDAVIRRTLEASFLPIVEGYAFEGAQRVANLRKLAARAGELAADGKLSLIEIVSALAEREGQEPEGESPLADENTDAVRVLTVHAAKGLEAPVVFVPDLARGDANIRDDVEVGVLPGHWGLALVLKAKQARNAAHVAWERENDRHGAAESMRLLYVALTRACDRIVLLAGTPSGSSPANWLAPLAAWGYRQSAPPEDGALLENGRIVHRVLTELPKTVAADARPIEGAPQATIAYARAEETLAAMAAHPPLRVPSGLSEEFESTGAADDGERPLARDPARAVGTAVHRLLEHWRPGAPLDPTVIAAVSRAAAAQRRCDPEEVERGVTAIVGGFGTTKSAAMLAEAQQVRREAPVIRRDDDGTVWRGRADLILQTPAGDWVVVDFKTDAAGDDAALTARYAPQLRVYATALRDALRLSRTPSAQLWMLRTGAIVDIPV